MRLTKAAEDSDCPEVNDANSSGEAVFQGDRRDGVIGSVAYRRRMKAAPFVLFPSPIRAPPWTCATVLLLPRVEPLFFDLLAAFRGIAF